MSVYTIQTGNVDGVAKLMSAIKPEWWDYEGACEQLQDVNILAKLVGWYIGSSEDKPQGWMLCAEFEGYSYLSIECLGYDDNGRFVMEDQLQPLFVQAEEYARQKGLRNMKYIIGSADLSCHGRRIMDFADELKRLTSCGRPHFDYLVKQGFVPTGFIPNCYGENYHGVIMIKDLLNY